MKNILLIGLVALMTSLFVQASEAVTESVVGKKPQVNASWGTFYSYSYRHLLGTSEKFGVPEKLDVDLQLLGLSYEFKNNYSLRWTHSYVKNAILLKFGPTKILGKTEGLGDTYVGLHKKYQIHSGGQLELAAQMSLPSGDFKQSTSQGRLISYPGQLGSGTYDFVPKLAYKFKSGSNTLNITTQAKFRTGRNDIGYRLGNEFRGNVSYDYWVFKGLAVNAGFSYKTWQSVVGVDKVDSYNTANKKAAPPSSHGGGHQPSSTHGPRAIPPDPFADAGSRWSANLAVKAAMFVGAGKGGIFEVGRPVYSEQAGSLEGLSSDWYARAQLVLSF